MSKTVLIVLAALAWAAAITACIIAGSHGWAVILGLVGASACWEMAKESESNKFGPDQKCTCHRGGRSDAHPVGVHWGPDEWLSWERAGRMEDQRP